MGLSVLTRTILVSTGLLVVLVVVVALSLLIGTSTHDLASILLFGTSPDALEKARTILLEYRLPRTLLAVVAGAGLASAGVVFQAILRNPLADPYLVGIAAGGALGAVVSIVLMGEYRIWMTSFTAFLGSLLAAGSVYGLASLKKGAGYVHTVILAGVIVAALLNAVMMLIISLSESDEIQRILFWLMGDLSFANYGKLIASSVVVFIGWIFIYLNANHLNLLITGEETATGLGLSVPVARTTLMGVAALVTGAVVSVAGTIGFVGLVVPHAMRLLFGPDHRVLLPASLLGGACFLAAADCAARVVAYPVELPVGVVTALAGAPFFLYLLTRR